jgi:hypothetical protein
MELGAPGNLVLNDANLVLVADSQRLVFALFNVEELQHRLSIERQWKKKGARHVGNHLIAPIGNKLQLKKARRHLIATLQAK